MYGATGHGGSINYGTIYKLNKDGSGYSILRNFVGSGGDGNAPIGALLEVTRGVFYGTTQYGGDLGAGCVFALSTAPLPPRALSLSFSNGLPVVQFRATSLVQYDVQRCTDLASWSVLTTLTSPTDGEFSFFRPQSSSTCRVLPASTALNPCPGTWELACFTAVLQRVKSCERNFSRPADFALRGYRDCAAPEKEKGVNP